jgi:hypothetical protein
VRQQNDSTKEEFDRRMNNGESIDEIFKSFRSRLLKTEKAERIDNAELDKIMKEAGELVATQVLQTLADDGKLALAAARRAMVKKLTDPNFVQLLIAEQPKAILSELTDGPFALGPSGETIDVEGEPNDG